MRTTIGKNTRTLRLLLLVGIPLVMTLGLLLGTAALHVPGFAPFSFVHAMTLQATCASTHGKQANLCNKQNPITQHCTQDAQSIEVVSVFTPQNVLIGEVDIRHSNACRAYWIRTVAYATASQVQEVDTVISFNDGQVQNHRTTMTQPGQRLTAFTDLFQPTVIPPMTGIFHLRGQPQSLTIPL